MDSSAGFSVPPPPTLPTNGSLPSRRLQTQAPPSEPPACVQNAMMTKDKKPFTYTPGGIDLSQIKSPRMAKRIARNAQHEGITNQPRPSPLAQDNTYPGPPPPASAMGLPVQVFPSGPPPPPPPPPSSNSVGVPPPPPPMSLLSSNQLTAQTNGRDTRKSPTPQNFEPPPLGMRPEIKIPPNPMATLRKVPKPEPKNDFWVEEYRRENSKSPLPGDGDTSDKQQEQQNANQNYHQENPRVPSPPKPDNINRAEPEADNISPRKEFNRVNFQQPRPQSQQLPTSRPIQQTSPQQSPAAYQQNQAYPQQSPYSQQQPQQAPIQQQQQQQPEYPPHLDPNRIAFQQQRWGQPQSAAGRPSSPPKQQSQYPAPPPPQQPSGQYQQPRQTQGYVTPNMQRVDSPFQTQQDQSNFQRPFSPINAANKPQMQPNYYGRQQQPQQQQPQPSRQNVTSPTSQQKPTQIGSLYIAPVAPENLAFNGNEQQRQQGLPQTPSWLSQRPSMKEDPDWIREVNSPPATNRIQSPPVGSVQNNAGSGPGLKLQMNIAPTSSNAKERIIPIQLEKTPTPTRTPNTPAFGPQPYSSGSQQYGSVASPTSGYSSPTVNIIRNPNHFVDQGYNNFSNSNQYQWTQQPPQRVASPPNQSGGTRIIPIAVERDDGPFGSNATRGPTSPSPMVIQNDPRQQQQQSRTNGTPTTPNQSKSFRVLQRITDTNATGRDSDNEQPAELQRPQYSRQMGAINDSTEQMRRMQINDSPDNTQANWGPIQRQTQKYVQQRPIYAQDEQPQQYVHPSEQQVHEPKIYTGSAIPSRSFKLLQAMTTPENAGPGQSDL